MANLGMITSIEVGTYKTSKGITFKKVNFTVSIEQEDGELRYVKGSYGLQAFIDYMNFVGVKDAKEIVGLRCSVVLEPNTFIGKDGNEVTIDKVKYINLIDQDGNPIIKGKDVDLSDIVLNG